MRLKKKFELITQRAKQLYDNPECGLSSQVAATSNLEMAASPEQYAQVRNWIIARYIVTACIMVVYKQRAFSAELIQTFTEKENIH